MDNNDPARNKVPEISSVGTRTVSGRYLDGPENGLLPPNQPLSPQQQHDAGELGQSGTLISGGGFISFEEYNKDLEGRKGLRQYDQMRKSDATVKQSLKAVKQPILSAVFSIEAASDDPEHQMHAQFVRDNLFDGDIDFHRFLEESLTMLEFGFSLAEQVFEYDDWQGYEHVASELVEGDIDPLTGLPTKSTKQTSTKFAGGTYLRLKKLAFRRQLTVYRWQTEAQKAGVTQTTYTGGFFSIPEDKIVLFTHEREGDNFQGVSLLRPAYKHWFYKETLYKIQVMAMQRQGMGIPQLTAPEDADEPSKAAARTALKNIRANESSYIEIPKGYIIDFMDMKGLSVIDCSHAIEHHDHKILSNVLAGFLDLGQQKGSGGSRALSEDLSRLFTQSLDAVAQYFCEVVNDQIIKRLLDYNFTTDVYPQITYGSLADDNTGQIADALGKLSNADLITPDPELEDFIRDLFKLPALPDDIRENYNNRARSQAATVPDMKDPNSEDNASGNSDVEATEIIATARALRERIGKRLDATRRR